ncbi:hypothetical protein NDU88_007583, partial [Pleurodeles waltl]
PMPPTLGTHTRLSSPCLLSWVLTHASRAHSFYAGDSHTPLEPMPPTLGTHTRLSSPCLLCWVLAHTSLAHASYAG